MRFLVSRVASFRDREPWGPNVDMEDEVRRVHNRGNSLPRALQPWATRFFQLIFGLRLLWLSRKYDAVAIGRHGIWFPIFLRLLGSKKRVVMIDTEWPGWGTGLMNRFAGNAASVICVFTQAETERLSRRFRIPREKLRFVPMAFQRSDLREPRDEGYVFVGGNYGRDWETLLRAVDGLPYPVRIFTNISKVPPVPPNVRVGSLPREEYYVQMAGASCVVIPLFPEPLRITGMTTWTNAMAMGKVVIATEPIGAPDYIDHGVSGFYVDYGDVGALRYYIELVMKDSELRERVGEAARGRAWREFSPHVFRRRVLSLLEADAPVMA